MPTAPRPSSGSAPSSGAPAEGGGEEPLTPAAARKLFSEMIAPLVKDDSSPTRTAGAGEAANPRAPLPASSGTAPGDSRGLRDLIREALSAERAAEAHRAEHERLAGPPRGAEHEPPAETWRERWWK